MATLIQLREAVRRQTETTSAELPDVTINGYLRQAFNRTINQINRWPSYEQIWALTLPAGETRIPLPTDLNRKAVNSLINTSANWPYRMQMVDQETAEDLYLGQVVMLPNYTEYSIWGNYLYVWPLIERIDDWEFTLRGYREPVDWIAQGDAAVVDADERLHWPLANYAIALAYAQQEDEVLEDTYMKRWQADISAAISGIMEPVHDLPLTFGGGKRTPYNGLRAWWP